MLITESIGFDPIIRETISATASKMPLPKPLTENLAILNSMRRTGLLLRDEDIQEYYQQQVKALMEKKSTLTLAQHKTNTDILKAVYTWNESAHTNLEWALTALKDTVDQLRAVNSAFYCNLDCLLEEEPQRIQAYLERHQKVNVTLKQVLSMPSTQSALQYTFSCYGKRKVNGKRIETMETTKTFIRYRNWRFTRQSLLEN